MTEWTLLKRLLDAVHQHSTMIGRLWLTVMVIFRLLVVAVATEDVYADEQEMFVCNTLQPGCPTVCYDAFAPISQPRFWVFHIISVSAPSLCFIVYTWHRLSKTSPSTAHSQGPGLGADPVQDGPDVGQRRREAHEAGCDSDSCSVHSHKHLADMLQGTATHGLQRGGPDHTGGTRSHARDGDADGHSVPGGVLSRCYVVHVLLRAVLEAGFVLAQWKLFGFQVPAHFLCRWAPCGPAVDCYVSRPTEKTVFLLFMFCVGVFCILLNLLELNHLGWKKVRQVLVLRGGPPWGCRPGAQGGYETLPLDSPSITSTTSLPTLDLVMGHRPLWTCAGNCEVMKGPGGARGEDEELRRQDSHKGERQTPRSKTDGRGSKQRGAEVWI
ncbi:gap junction delta-2 protein-like [Antennarius striatus]|uniref:gap junction delta-2 protein-like n=1 Tax=Antennarius striatus TaxID=241820 RepID=UPI0035B05A85